MSKVNMFPRLKTGDRIPPSDIVVYPLALNKTVKNVLVDLISISSEQPLVINFGSCSWPPFLGSLSQFGELAGDFAERAKFITIYIEEAHPIEGWMYGSVTHQIHQHTSLEERMVAASILKEEFQDIYAKNETLEGMKPPPVYVDGIDNRASLAFGALPERLVILLNGQVKFIGGKGPEEYSVMECRRALEKLLCSEWS
jgi:hypothetical protein